MARAANPRSTTKAMATTTALTPRWLFIVALNDADILTVAPFFESPLVLLHFHPGDGLDGFGTDSDSGKKQPVVLESCPYG